MQNPLKTIFCALLLLALAGSTAVFAGRNSSPSLSCHATARIILGALEMYNMENAPFAANGVRQIDREFLAPLVKSKYLTNIDSYFNLEKRYHCQFYLVRADENTADMIFCRQHGSGQYKDRNLSPRQQFELYCREYGMDASAYNIDLGNEVLSDMVGSPLMVYVANLWPMLLILPVIFFVKVVRRRSGAENIATAYLFGNSIVAFLLIFSFINIYYFSTPIPNFMKFSGGNYPPGADWLSLITTFAILIWWLISLLNTLVSVVRKKEFMLPLVFTLLAPLAFFLVESHILAFHEHIPALSFPLLGALLIYLMSACPRDK